MVGTIGGMSLITFAVFAAAASLACLLCFGLCIMCARRIGERHVPRALHGTFDRNEDVPKIWDVWIPPEPIEEVPNTLNPTAAAADWRGVPVCAAVPAPPSQDAAAATKSPSTSHPPRPTSSASTIDVALMIAMPAPHRRHAHVSALRSKGAGAVTVQAGDDNSDASATTPEAANPAHARTHADPAGAEAAGAAVADEGEDEELALGERLGREVFLGCATFACAASLDVLRTGSSPASDSKERGK